MIEQIGGMQLQMLQSMEQMKSLASGNVSVNSGGKFSNALTDAISKSNSVQVESADLARKFISGDPSVTMAEVIGASQKSSIALEMTNQVKNKALSSYTEILNLTF